MNTEATYVLPYDPEQLVAFAAGAITLADLEGIPKSAQVEMAKVGFEHLQQGRLDPAEKIFRGLVALDPFDAYFHMALGAIAHKKNDLETAEKFFSRSLEINPFSAPCRAHRGEVRMALGNLEGAIEDLIACVNEDVEAKDPSTVRARALLSALRENLEQGVTEEAKAEVAKAEAAKKAAAKSVVKAAPNPVVKTAPKPVVKAAPKPAPKPVAKIAPKLVAKPAPKPVAKPAPKAVSAKVPPPKKPS